MPGGIPSLIETNIGTILHENTISVQTRTSKLKRQASLTKTYLGWRIAGRAAKAEELMVGS